VGGLEAAQELIERVQDLLGQALADLVLELAAVLQQRRQTLRPRQTEQARLAQEQAERGGDRPPGGLHHVSDAEVQPAGALAARRREQAQRAPVAQQPGGHPALAQQALHAAVGRDLELTAFACDAVEVLAWR
jgi:hypothetical protein